MASARAYLIALGFSIATIGLYVAWSVERLLGTGILLVGAFLVVLPFAQNRSDE